MMDMMKVRMWLVGLAVLLITSGALAQESVDVSDVSEDEITPEMQELLDEGGTLARDQTDSLCVLSPPVPYLIHFCTNTSCGSGGYVAVTDIWQDPTDSRVYHICSWDTPTGVDGVKVWWTASSAVCDYCEMDDWYGIHWESGVGTTNDVNSCSHGLYGSHTYYSYEYTYYTNYNGFPTDPQVFFKFERTGTSTDSILVTSDCSPEK